MYRRLRKKIIPNNQSIFLFALQILPQFIFNSRDPIVIGVMVENGIVKEGTPICVPSKEVNIQLYSNRFCYCLIHFYFVLRVQVP